MPQRSSRRAVSIVGGSGLTAERCPLPCHVSHGRDIGGRTTALEQRADLVDWLDSQFAQYEAHYSSDPPERTDDGDTAAPKLEPVYPVADESALRHAEMHNVLVERFGLKCWGCDFHAPDPRYLELDHIDPRANGGSNSLDNRALLCRPCNQVKSNNLTLAGLWRENRREGFLQSRTPPIDIRGARDWTRAFLDQHRRQTAHQLEPQRPLNLLRLSPESCRQKENLNMRYHVLVTYEMIHNGYLNADRIASTCAVAQAVVDSNVVYDTWDVSILNNVALLRLPNDKHQSVFTVSQALSEWIGKFDIWMRRRTKKNQDLQKEQAELRKLGMTYFPPTPEPGGTPLSVTAIIDTIERHFSIEGEPGFKSIRVPIPEDYRAKYLTGIRESLHSIRRLSAQLRIPLRQYLERLYRSQDFKGMLSPPPRPAGRSLLRRPRATATKLKSRNEIPNSSVTAHQENGPK